MTITLQRTDSNNEAFIALVQLLDAELAERDGEDHGFYAQFNGIAVLKHVIVAIDESGNAVACGAIKPFGDDAMEVKRMYTRTTHRGKRFAASVLAALENWAAELGYNKCVLETGKKQPEAIALYTRMGYAIIPNYGQYIGVENSVCFQKRLTITQ